MGRLCRGLASRRHGDAAVRVLERQDVIDAVSGHGYRVSGVFQDPDKFPFLIRRDTAEYGVVKQCLCQRVLIVQFGGVHIFVCIFDAGLFRHFRYGYRIISGYDFHFHALFREIFKSLFRGLADRVCQKDESERCGRVVQRLPVDLSVICPEDKHTGPGGGVFRDLLLVFIEPVLQDEFRRPQYISAVFKCNAAVLCGGGESGHGYRLLSRSGREVFFNGGHGDVVFCHGCGKVADEGPERFHGFFIIFFCLDHILHLHGILRDGAGFIHAQHIHPGQCLDAFHIVEQDFLLGQPDCAYRKGHTGEQVEPLRDHADHRSDHGCNALPEIVMLEEKCLAEQDDPDRDDRDAHAFDQFVKRTDHLRLLPGLHFFRLERQFRDIGVCSYPVQSCMALAGHDEASGHEPVPFALGDLV